MESPDSLRIESKLTRTHSGIRQALASAVLTVISLFGGLLAGVAAGNIIFNIIPGHSVQNPKPIAMAASALPALAGFLAGGALWGAFMGNLAHATERRRMAWAGMLGFAPVTLGLGFGLSLLEPVAVQRFGQYIPIHRLFTLFFVPTAFLIAGIGAWAIGIGLRNRRLAGSLLLQVGGAAALAFLMVNLVMEASGWRVGAPQAAERFTMLVVMFAGNLAAAFAGGFTLGWRLAPQG